MASRQDYRKLLKEELHKRCEKNPSYSLRAFSRLLQTSPAQLSQIISGKRPLTVKAAVKIADRLNFSPVEKSHLLESTLQRVALHPGESRQQAEPIEIREEEFQLISKWHHFAILSLSEIKNHKSDPRWVAGRLGISVSEASEALERLSRLRIIKISGGKIRQVIKPIKTTSEVPSSAIRLYHQENLDLAKQKLAEVPVELREYSSITMAISLKKIPKAKKMITEFKHELASLLESDQKEAVYHLSVQLFPIQKMEKL